MILICRKIALIAIFFALTMALWGCETATTTSVEEDDHPTLVDTERLQRNLQIQDEERDRFLSLAETNYRHLIYRMSSDSALEPIWMYRFFTTNNIVHGPQGDRLDDLLDRRREYTKDGADVPRVIDDGIARIILGDANKWDSILEESYRHLYNNYPELKEMEPSMSQAVIRAAAARITPSMETLRRKAEQYEHNKQKELDIPNSGDTIDDSRAPGSGGLPIPFKYGS